MIRNQQFSSQVVLNESQRKAKRRLIQENREKRNREELLRQSGLLFSSRLTEKEENLIRSIESEEPDTKRQKTVKPIAEIMAPSIVKVVEFAKRIPGFKDITDLRTISARHTENIMRIKLDNYKDIPPIFVEMFRDCSVDVGQTERGHSSPPPEERTSF
ncbi:Thyroid hormone receptor alpha-A [Holothuria leucospilota]|uniref:Thyroid hormone receptor alpha-A n=1 Tax=Holothuria leucospilota TaxID=206669 RepID=A0A9Q0YB65_HOLLE|nr:Thyroid hormone receptor alpha-A [Holothuria leucospilota]